MRDIILGFSNTYSLHVLLKHFGRFTVDANAGNPY